MGKQDVIGIAEFCTVVQSLRKLNISNNGLTVQEFALFFDLLKPQSYSLTHIDLSWNSMSDEGSSAETLQDFRNKFADFLRYSRTL